MNPYKTVAFYTLGCKLNFSETSTIARLFEQGGYAKVDFDDRPDIYVINTCSVTDHADKKCRNLVRRAKSKNPDAFIAVVGCYAQLKPDEIANITGVNVVLGANEKFNIIDYLEKQPSNGKAHIENGHIKEVKTFIPSYSANDRTRTFLKIQDGCDYFCSFCTIPLARGRSRNQSIEETLKVAKEVAQNAKQNVLVAGSLPPAFGSYRPELFESERAFTILDTLYKAQDEHVNLWIGETISSIEEAHVMASVLKGSNKPCYYAFTLTDAISEQATLRSGELVSDAVTALLEQNVAGIFFNCSIPEVIEQAFSDTNAVLAKQNKSVVLGAFANGFTPIARDYKANEGSQAYRDISPSEYLDFAKKWHSQGASIIGGCCGIGPEFIEVLVSWKKELESA